MKITKPAPEWKAKVKCHHCKVELEVEPDDLERDMFKKDPNTYWFDGSAKAVPKCYVHCPNKCDIIFVKDVPPHVEQHVIDNGKSLCER